MGVRLEGFSDVTAILRGGVYALVLGGSVVYVGKAKTMLARVATHRGNARRKVPAWMPASAKGIVFDEVHVMPCHPDVVDDLEHAMIDFYQPIHNILLKGGTPRVKAQLTITTASGATVSIGGDRPRVNIERRV